MTRGKQICISLLRTMIQQGREKSRKNKLAGSLNARTETVEACQNYLAIVRMSAGKSWDKNNALDRVVAELRKDAGNTRLTATARLKTVERLLWIQGFITQKYREPLDEYIANLLGEKKVEKPADVQPPRPQPAPIAQMRAEADAEIQKILRSEDD